jgi:hypothetical protein
MIRVLWIGTEGRGQSELGSVSASSFFLSIDVRADLLFTSTGPTAAFESASIAGTNLLKVYDRVHREATKDTLSNCVNKASWVPFLSFIRLSFSDLRCSIANLFITNVSILHLRLLF